MQESSKGVDNEEEDDRDEVHLSIMLYSQITAQKLKTHPYITGILWLHRKLKVSDTWNDI